jgi:hypothetical protein
MEVGMAQATRLHPHEDLPGRGSGTGRS